MEVEDERAFLLPTYEPLQPLTLSSSTRNKAIKRIVAARMFFKKKGCEKMKEKILIDGVEYIKKEQIDETKSPYVLVRADRAGVFVGNLMSRNGGEVVMSNCRRVFYWDGAASVSQLALTGPSKPQNCKFPAPVDNQIILGVIEILPVTESARKAIDAVKIWQA